MNNCAVTHSEACYISESRSVGIAVICGGWRTCVVTRAASKLQLTQSAVSMQIKRMEQHLDQALLKRVGRRVELSGQGEQLLGYVHRMVALNDEAWGRRKCPQFKSEITLGVPHDIAYPYIPNILREFNAAYPCVKVSLKSSNTCFLKARFAAGVPNIILTTELPQAGTVI